MCVDLDGTLIRTDLLHECAVAFVRRNPLRVFLLFAWLLGGKAKLKQRLAERVDLQFSLLPYREEVVALIREAKEQGRRVVLATASNERLARGVAEHLQLFDEVIASDVRTNLAGTRKRDALVARFGERGFAYIGDAPVDLPIWRSSAQAILAGRRSSLVRGLDGARVLENTDRSRLRSAVKTLRLHQWSKNVLVFLPIFTAHRFAELPMLLAGVGTFFAFGLCASSVYILNDLLDLEADRAHPTKKARPFASGELSVAAGVVLSPVLLACGLSLAAWLAMPLFGLLVAYFALNLAYTFWLKQVVVVDVLLLASMYTARIFAGAAATSLFVSPWLLAFSMFFFVSLALVKRCAELSLRRARNEEKLAGRAYVTADLETVRSLGTSTGGLAVLVFALYLQSDIVRSLYTHPERLWAMCPLILYWVGRVWLLVNRGEMNQDPVVFALKDRVSYVVGALGVAVALIAR